MNQPAMIRERRVLRVVGVVQGVGFRPHVHLLATRLGLAGFVQNRTGDVWIEVEGDPPALDQFTAEIQRDPPPLARIRSLEHAAIPPQHDHGFTIRPSTHTTGHPGEIPPDIATCPDCLRELADPADRRHRHPFINCTNCGPRFTIINNLPYDRERTTMTTFVMCPSCRREYDDPTDRRFHAQPVACPACGPTLRLTDTTGAEIPGDPIPTLAQHLVDGRIAIIKSLGGYHLACDATSDDVIKRLRTRKRRDEKPFAVMVRDLAAAESLAHLDDAARALLTSPARPIVLVPRRPDTPIAPGVAPESALLGLLLPYTPLHHLLLHAVPCPLVMTSGNLTDDPIVHTDPLHSLTKIADLLLDHDRPIAAPCEDSVLRAAADGPIVLRRARGFAPLADLLPIPLKIPTLALGPQLKAVFALGRDATATLGPHIGDLDHAAAYASYLLILERMERLLDFTPALLVHDTHPDYATTRLAHERSARDGTPLLAVQHHHAHMAACMAEHGLLGPAIGVTFDGLGHGDDDTMWGGEFLVGDLATVRRAASLAPTPMPGGAAALREPWRMAVAHLEAAGISAADTPLAARIPAREFTIIKQIAARAIHSPRTSSIGRLFDAVAALAGVCDRATFEGQAAMRLESLALQAQSDLGYPLEIVERRDHLVLDPRPLIRGVVADLRASVPPARIARKFHTTIVDAILAVCTALRATTGLTTVALGGGVFNNSILACETVDRLERAGFSAHRPRRHAPGDGGIALGQLAVAAARQARGLI